MKVMKSSWLSNYVVLDFETRSKFDIRKGAWFYANHPSTTPLCMSFKFKDGKVQSISNLKTIVKICKKIEKLKIRVIAHNSWFDFCIFRRLTGCPISHHFNYWMCTSLLSRYCGGPKALRLCTPFFGLELAKYNKGKDLIKVLSIPYSGKIPKGFAKMKLRPEKSGFVENEELLKEMMDYCEQDVLVTEKLYLKLGKWANELTLPKVKKDLYLNEKRNIAGLKVIEKELNAIIDCFSYVEEWCKKASKKIAGENFNINSSLQMIKFFAKNGHKIDSMSKDTLSVRLNSFPEKLKKLCYINFAYPKSHTRKPLRMVELIENGKISGNFIYYGAGRTGRFTTEGTNILNLPRGDKESYIKKLKLLKKGNEHFFKEYGLSSTSELSNMIRHTIVSQNGKFYGGDFKQIDLRLLLLVAGEHKTLRAMFKGMDLYKHFASNIYKTPFDKVTKQQRTNTKAVVLGAGYGRGADSLYQQMRAEGLNTTRGEVEAIKNSYHKFLPNVRMLWHNLEMEFNEKGFFTIPYFKDRIILNHVPSERLWGGSLTGILIQAFTQSLMNWKCRQLWRMLKMNPCLVFHDEVVVDVKDSPKNFENFKKALELAPPNFSKNFPSIQCEFWSGKRYE